jgi:hypothetical protein
MIIRADWLKIILTSMAITSAGQFLLIKVEMSKGTSTDNQNVVLVKPPNETLRSYLSVMGDISYLSSSEQYSFIINPKKCGTKSSKKMEYMTHEISLFPTEILRRDKL